MLRESNDYVSGQQLCEKLGVSRTAVWKAINQLKEEGYQVEAVRNRGYHIVESPDIISREELASMIDTEWAGQKVYYYNTTDSTNIRAKQLGEEGAPPRNPGHGRPAERRKRAPRQRMGVTGGQQRVYVNFAPAGDSAGESAYADFGNGFERCQEPRGMHRFECSD